MSERSERKYFWKTECLGHKKIIGPRPLGGGGAPGDSLVLLKWEMMSLGTVVHAYKYGVSYYFKKIYVTIDSRK